MADEDTEPGTVEEGGEDEPQSGKMLSVILLVVGIAAGSGAGLFFVGPLVAGGPADTTEVADGAEDAGDGHEAPADDGHGAPAEIGDDGVDPLLHILGNVIVNPSGSGGSRFLLLDVAVRLSTEEAVNELSGRDPEVRDAMIQLLGVMTVSELAEISSRDAIKTAMSKIISSILTSGSVTAIFFPRYVIQ